MVWIRSQCSVILQSPARQSSAGRLNIYQISLVRRLKYYPHCILQERGKKTGSRIQTFVFKNLNLFWLQPAASVQNGTLPLVLPIPSWGQTQDKDRAYHQTLASYVPAPEYLLSRASVAESREH